MSLGLVSYGSSSSSEDDQSDNEENQAKVIVPPSIKKLLRLPKPLNDDTDESNSLNLKVSEEQDNAKTIQNLLPTPKAAHLKTNIIEVEDEFLNKKAIPSEKPPSKVKISIPRLSDFKDLETNQTKNHPREYKAVKPGGLLSLLPKPKSEFSKPPMKTNLIPSKAKSNTFLVPESVKKRNTTPVPLQTPLKKKLVSCSDSDDSEEETDFFSLQKEIVLPKVNINEINEMVSKKAAQMAEAFTKSEPKEGSCEETPQFTINSEETTTDHQFNKLEAIKVLSGHKEAKRRKLDDVQFIELSDEQIMPSKSEWYRTALASSTTYQRRGIVDQEDQPGTRRKNQITYLANQALANDSELQAMWSENRANRRATQNKYGF
ncbi:PRCC family protein [Megaselia abdita]